ncbi:MAG: DUF550 domain-containing protein [Ruminococcaceae bacterium]|nr:DUF550 domain-containing protein [Oscillospiraceae bacterium]
MADVKISDLLRMQHTLAETKGWLGDRTPEHAPMSILWSIDELGEAIAIIKKKGSQAIMDNESVREHFVEEVADVFMYLFDMMESYGITAEEFSDAYVGKFRRNMGRDWVENDAMYEKIPVRRLILSLAMVESAPEQAARMVEVLSKTDVKLTLIAHADTERIRERLMRCDISPDAFAMISADFLADTAALMTAGLAEDAPDAAAALVLDPEEKMAAVQAGIRTISFAADGLGTDYTCGDLTEVANILAAM